MTRERLLMIASTGRPFREYILADMSTAVDLILVDDRDLSWQKPYVSGFHQADPRDPVAVAEIARAEAPDGLLTYDDALVEMVADLAAERGLPQASPAAVRRCKDKAALRACLDAAGVGPVRFAVVTDQQEALAAAEDIGYPVVLKPRDLGGSIGVVRADDKEQLLAGYAMTAGTRARFSEIDGPPGVLVEEYLDGPEFSVDCLTWRGVTHPLFVAEKVLGLAPYFEEVGHIVPAAPHPDMDEALRLVREAHRAAGLDDLATHTEFRLTSRGPRIIEINVRLGGDLIPHLGKLATGIDLSVATADVAVGREPRLAADRSRVAAVHMIYPPHDMTFRRLRLDRDPGRLPGLERFEAIVPEGRQVRLPPNGFRSRVGYAVITGADRAECLARCAAVEAAVVVEGETH
ncbi:ATP-grasp domain-containing protein [Streptomyces sp. SCSIO ZS0520]|uniref:ATP-grasp domain-containing protein n=1 Tax=Streptomyces sp. SCSIO ZS0520 TaxID=2892996 RepID=UPI0021DB5593|nr:ATP-grasp domain-containing protein [Streptomyces sp. SCSIO ZS0520]